MCVKQNIYVCICSICSRTSTNVPNIQQILADIYHNAVFAQSTTHIISIDLFSTMQKEMLMQIYSSLKSLCDCLSWGINML